MKPQAAPPALFDRALHRHFRARHAAHFNSVDFLFNEAAILAGDRLEDITHRFPHTALLGGHQGLVAEVLRTTGKVDWLIEAEETPAMLGPRYGRQMICDFEHLPFARASLDALVAVGSLHWVNDLVGCLIQARLALKPDGLLLAVLPGARSLIELREALLAVGMEDGLAPRLSPLVDVRDAGNLLSRAGFALPVADSEMLDITYPDLSTMLRELRRMGQGNALTQRSRLPTTRSFWKKVEEAYHAQHADAEGRLKMSVELVTLTAWKPHESQQQPAKRGSGQMHLGEILQ